MPMLRQSRIRVLAAVVVLAALLLPGAALAEGRRRGPVVFEPEQSGSVEVVDLGMEGFGPGDTILERKPLFDPRSGARRGTAVTRVQIVESLQGGDFVFVLDCTIRLRRGALMFYGAGQFSQLQQGVTFAVIGGTGRFTDNEGTVTVTLVERDGEPGARIAFRLARQ